MSVCFCGTGAGRIWRSDRLQLRNRVGVIGTVVGRRSSARMASGMLGPDPVFAQTMKRIKDPAKSRHFYEELLGMQFLTRLDFPKLDFSLHFYATAEGEKGPGDEASNGERAQWMWSRRYPTLELTHNYGTEDKDDFAHHNGNSEPFGYKQVNFLVDDVASAYDRLTEVGVEGVQPPATLVGDQKHAVVADPDGYWVALLDKPAKGSGSGGSLLGADPVFSGAVLRVNDPEASRQFYEDLGLKTVAVEKPPGAEHGTYFMSVTDWADVPGVAGTPEDAAKATTGLRSFMLVLYQPPEAVGADIQFHNGNSAPQGFGHIGFIVTDPYEVVKDAEAKGVVIKRQAGPFQDAGEIAFIADPDGYLIELIKRNGAEEATPYAQ